MQTKTRMIEDKPYYYRRSKAMEQAEPADYILVSILGGKLETGGVIVWQRLKESGRVFRWISKQIDEKYHNAPWTIISAWRPKEEKTFEENKKSTRELINTLWHEGYSAIPLKWLIKDKIRQTEDWGILFFVPGIVKGIKEISYMVKYTEFKKFTEKLSKKYNQDWYIIYNPENNIIELWLKKTNPSITEDATEKYHLSVKWNPDSFNPNELINIYKSRFKEAEKDLDKTFDIQQNTEQLQEGEPLRIRVRIYEGFLKIAFTWMQAISYRPQTIVYAEILTPFFNV